MLTLAEGRWVALSQQLFVMHRRVQGMSDPVPGMPHSATSAEPTDSGDNVTRSVRSRQMAALVVDVYAACNGAMQRCALCCLNGRPAADAALLALLQWLCAPNSRHVRIPRQPLRSNPSAPLPHMLQLLHPHWRRCLVPS